MWKMIDKVGDYKIYKWPGQGDRDGQNYKSVYKDTDFMTVRQSTLAQVRAYCLAN
jgi:hypothetical protein